jgi:excisionase family DNA binding protein
MAAIGGPAAATQWPPCVTWGDARQAGGKAVGQPSLPKWQSSHGLALFHTGLTLDTGVTDAPDHVRRSSSVGREHTMAADATPLSDVRFLTVAEVAAIMRVSKMTVYRLVHSGELEAIRVGRSFRVPEQAVTGYLREAYVGTE